MNLQDRITLHGYAIIEDTREQHPLDFGPTGIPSVTKKLDTGDYSALGYERLFTIERKSADDLVNTVIHDRERFERELTRMRDDGYEYVAIFCEAAWVDILHGQYRSMANPDSVLGSLDAFAARYGVPTFFCSHPVYCFLEQAQSRIERENIIAQAERLNRAEMAQRIARLIKYFVREKTPRREWDRRQRQIEKLEAEDLSIPPTF